MNNILLFLALSLCAILAPAHAARVDPPMQQAIEHLVASQNLDQLWPLMVASSATTGADQIARGAQESIDANPALTPAQRVKARAVAAQFAAPMAAELNELHRQLPVKALVREMVETVYTKYFSAAEIEEMARFYSGPVFQKMARMQVDVSEESARTGQRAGALWPKYMARLSPQETRALMEFNGSPLGVRMQKLQPAVSGDMREFIAAKTQANLEAVFAKYVKLMRIEIGAAGITW